MSTRPGRALRSLVALAFLAAACSPDAETTPAERGVSVGKEAPVPLGETAPAEPPATNAAHGVFLGSDGAAVTATVDIALATQAYYAKRLLGEAESDVAREFEIQRANAYDKDDLSPEARVSINGALLEWLIVAVNPEDSALLRNLNGALVRTFGAKGTSEGIGVASEAITTTTGTSGQAYMDTCAAAGVPKPPDWRSSQWTRQGSLMPDFLGITTTTDVFTFTSNSPRGLCIGLSRFSDTSIVALAIICQGNDTSKACFWDSNVNANISTTGPALPIVSSSFVGGQDLVANNRGVCTDCHAGENAFIVHPGSALDRGAWLRAKGWVNPLVPSSYPQNRRPGHDLDLITPPAGQLSCVSCHNKANHTRFPRLKETGRSLYCSTVAETALRKTMPPGNVGSARSSVHGDAIVNGCGNTPTPAGKFGVQVKANDFFSLDQEAPMVGDFNNDGRTDILTMVFGSARDVYVALSNGSAFTGSSVWHSDFDGSPGGSFVGDFNGDGMDDIVMVYDSSDAYDVALSDGTKFGTKTRFWTGTAFFGSRTAADVTNDGKDDIIIYNARTTASATSTEVWVQTAKATGAGFNPPERWIANFATGGRYALGDFNGDGFKDLVRFDQGTTGDVWVAINTGGNLFSAPTKWHDWFSPNGEVPEVGDVNGDGFDDIITFLRGSSGDVFVATSDGTKFNGTGVLWHDSFGSGSQSVQNGDIDGDGDADIILFTQGSAADVFVAKAVPPS